MSLAASLFPLARPLLHALDAEQAHHLTLRLLTKLPASRAAEPNSILAVEALGLTFPNPLGVAAGFDKNAEVPDAILALGFGFTEIGTVTPLPQDGNPRPRLFRLTEDKAVINRMGFNNAGHTAALRRLARRRPNGIVGVNIGANKESPDRVSDYVAGIATFSGLADYFTVNISSPNTPGLRALQSRDELRSLLSRLNAERAIQPRRPPMLLKIAPDLRDDELEDITACCGDGAVDGIIVSNTTLRREGLKSVSRAEQGGLSGAPLFQLSTEVLAKVYVMTGGRIPLVGVGGISNAETAWIKLRAGATLLQVYSALVYQGPALIREILTGLTARLEGRSIASIVGADATAIAHHGLSGI